MKKTIPVLSVFLFTLSLAFAWAEHGSIRVKVAPAPPQLTASVQFSEPSGNNILDAEETGKIIVTLRNSGQGDAFDVRAQLRTAAKVGGLSFAREVVIGTVPAGGVVKKEIPIIASEDILSAGIALTVDIKEANGFDPNPMKVSFTTKAFDPPKLVVADLGVNDQKGTGRVSPMDIVELTVRIQNMGHGDARNVTAEARLGQNVFVAANSMTHFDLGTIPSGQFKDIKFSFYTNNRIGNDENIPITIGLGEARPRFNVNLPLSLAMNAPPKRMEEVVVKGADTGNMGEIAMAGGLSVDVDMNIPEGEKAGRDDIAVVIGNRNYRASGSPDVDYANRDAKVMKDYLVKTMGYDPANIIYAEDATLTKFNEIFGTDRDHRGKLFKYVKEGGVQCFYLLRGPWGAGPGNGRGLFRARRRQPPIHQVQRLSPSNLL